MRQAPAVWRAALAAGLAACLGALVLPGTSAAAPKPKHVEDLILTPRAGKALPARPRLIRVRAARRAGLTARLNGHTIVRRHIRPVPHRRVRRFRASPNHGLRHGRNVLRVEVRPRGKRRARVQRIRFRIADTRPLAAAGLDRNALAGSPIFVSARESRVHPGGRSGAAAGAEGTVAPDEGLEYRWSIKRTPWGRPRRHRPLPGADSGSHTPRPILTRPGKYVLRVRVTAPDGQSGVDDVTVSVGAPPLVEVDTQVPTDDEEVWAIRVGQQVYDTRVKNPWLQILVLDRSTLARVHMRTFFCDPANASSPTLEDIQPCIDQVQRGFSGENELDSTNLVLAASHPLRFGSSIGVPEALRAIGVGVSDNRTWPGFPNEFEDPPPPGGYSAIGVPGHPPGTAAEAFARDLDKPCDRDCARLDDYLVQDPGDGLNFNWASAERVPFDTRAAGSSDGQNAIRIGDRTYTQNVGTEDVGGFQVVIADRYDLSKAENHYFPTNTETEQAYTKSLESMALTLRDAASTEIVNALPGREGKPHCIDARGGHFTRGTVVQSYTCNGTAAQQVIAVPGISPDGAGPVFELQIGASCIEVSYDKGRPLELAGCDGNERQQFRFDDKGRIRAYGGKGNPGGCVAISGDADDHSESGQPLMLSECQSWTSQRWRTDSSKLAFVAPVGLPRMRLTAEASQQTSAFRALFIDAVAQAVTALGGTEHAFNSLADHIGGRAETSIYGLVGWAGAAPARAPERSGVPSKEMPTARIAGTLSTDNWQRYEVQDTAPGASGREPGQPTGDACTDDLVACANRTKPVDVVWTKPTTVWPDQDPKIFPDAEERERKQAAVHWISNAPGLKGSAGDLRAAYFARPWNFVELGRWQHNRTTIKELDYEKDVPANDNGAFSKDDFTWAQGRLIQEIDWLEAARGYFNDLAHPMSGDKALEFEGELDSVKQDLEQDQNIAPDDSDSTEIWVDIVADATFAVVDSIGPEESVQEFFDGIASLIFLASDFTGLDPETQEPGPPSNTLAGAVADVEKELANQLSGDQDRLFGRIVASDPAKLETIGSLVDRCTADCPALWRLSSQDQAHLASVLRMAAGRTMYSLLVPAVYTAWQLRIAQRDRNQRKTGRHTVAFGYRNASSFTCDSVKAPSIRPFANAKTNGMAAFRVGWGYPDYGGFLGNDSRNGLLWKVWVLGRQQAGTNESYTVPGNDAFSKMFKPVDPALDYPKLGGLGVDKERWYVQAFVPRMYSPKSAAYYLGFSAETPDCGFDE